jgi:4-hydroxybenzoate polyprenyltransferase
MVDATSDRDRSRVQYPLERKRPTMPGPIHFLILLAASVTVFGVGFSVAWLIGRYCTVVYSFSIHTVKS